MNNAIVFNIFGQSISCKNTKMMKNIFSLFLIALTNFNAIMNTYKISLFKINTNLLRYKEHMA